MFVLCWAPIFRGTAQGACLENPTLGRPESFFVSYIPNPHVDGLRADRKIVQVQVGSDRNLRGQLELHEASLTCARET